ncbi:HAD-IA family hydrolase [bacterium]|nr:HAD-IA family hydrolase [bacterium]
MKAMKPLLTAVDAALFDLDGTLVETNIDFPLMKRKMIELASECGVDTSELMTLDILGVVDSACAVLDNQCESFRMRAMAILEEIEVGHAQKANEIPFAREMVGSLRKHDIKVGIVTRNCRRASESSLGIVGIQPDILICREDTTHHKPHPDPINAALSALDARASASVMVGDHTMDVACGKAAGVKTIGFLRDDRPFDFFSKVAPDYVADNLMEVLGAIIDYNR